MIFLMPVLQLLILSNAADYEVRHIYLHIADADISATSLQLAGKFLASGYFEVIRRSTSSEEGGMDLENGVADMVLEIPSGFELDLFR